MPKELLRRTHALVLCLAASLLTPFQCLARPASSEWRFYGGDQAGTRHSTLRQINRSNVGRLQRAWVYRTGELDPGLPSTSFRASFSTTPLVIEGVMYLTTPSSRVVALDAATGKTCPDFGSGGVVNLHAGGGNWSGGSFDPATGRLFVNMNEDGAVGEMTPQPAGAEVSFRRQGSPPSLFQDQPPSGWLVLSIIASTPDPGRVGR